MLDVCVQSPPFTLSKRCQTPSMFMKQRNFLNVDLQEACIKKKYPSNSNWHHLKISIYDSGHVSSTESKQALWPRIMETRSSHIGFVWKLASLKSNGLPSGKRLQKTNWKITKFSSWVVINYKSMAMAFHDFPCRFFYVYQAGYHVRSPLLT